MLEEARADNVDNDKEYMKPGGKLSCKSCKAACSFGSCYRSVLISIRSMDRGKVDAWVSGV